MLCQCGPIQRTDLFQPRPVLLFITDSVISLGKTLPSEQGQLGPKAGGEPDAEAERERFTSREAKISQIRVGFLEMRNRRNPAVLQRF